MWKFLKDEDGTTTVEFVLWIPVLALTIGAVVDGTQLMVGQTELWTVASNTSRLVSLNQMTVAEAEAFAKTAAGENKAIEVDVIVDGSTVVTRLARPFGDIPGFGVLTKLDQSLSVSATYRIEPSI